MAWMIALNYMPDNNYFYIRLDFKEARFYNRTTLNRELFYEYEIRPTGKTPPIPH